MESATIKRLPSIIPSNKKGDVLSVHASSSIAAAAAAVVQQQQQHHHQQQQQQLKVDSALHAMQTQFRIAKDEEVLKEVKKQAASSNNERFTGLVASSRRNGKIECIAIYNNGRKAHVLELHQDSVRLVKSNKHEKQRSEKRMREPKRRNQQSQARFQQQKAQQQLQQQQLQQQKAQQQQQLQQQQLLQSQVQPQVQLPSPFKKPKIAPPAPVANPLNIIMNTKVHHNEEEKEHSNNNTNEEVDEEEEEDDDDDDDQGAIHKHSYRGVSVVKHSHEEYETFRAQATINGRNQYLGTFATKEEAARKYDEAVSQQPNCKPSRLNFPPKATMATTMEERGGLQPPKQQQQEEALSPPPPQQQQQQEAIPQKTNQQQQAPAPL